jgi:hypothetical protein
VDLNKRLIDRLYGYLTLSYTFVGDPPGTDFRNAFGWSVGAAYSVTAPLAVFAFLEGSTAIFAGPVGSRRAPRRRGVQAHEGAEADRHGDEGIDQRCSGLGTGL